MKRFFALLLTLVMCLSIMACGRVDSETGETEPAEVTTYEATAPEEFVPSPEEEEAIDLISSDYAIDILDSSRTVDWQGRECLAVRFNFTNNSTDPAAYWITISDKAYQNGIELESSFPKSDSELYASYSNNDIEIKSGVTLEIIILFILNDTVSDVEVEFEEMFSWTDEKLASTVIPLS